MAAAQNDAYSTTFMVTLESSSQSDAQCLLKSFRKRFRFEQTLDKVLKQHRQQDHKIAI